MTKSRRSPSESALKVEEEKEEREEGGRKGKEKKEHQC